MDIARHPRILDAVEDLIGPDILLYLSTFWFKDAHDPRYVSWHQDSAYYGLDPHDVITLWLAFSDSTPANGCVRVLPGTHLGQSFDHTETYDADNLLARGQSIEGTDGANAIDMALKAGQFSLHHERLVHGSAPNTSDHRRLGMSFTLLPTRVRCLIPGRTAILLRGVDEYGHWGSDPEPSRDLDPDCMAAIQYWKDEYANPTIAQEADRTG
jgi:ectoine hydroxylase-related dioxygenase (phytanoyl-CoA dioxygenase family)